MYNYSHQMLSVLWFKACYCYILTVTSLSFLSFKSRIHSWSESLSIWWCKLYCMVIVTYFNFVFQGVCSCRAFCGYDLSDVKERFHHFLHYLYDFCNWIFSRWGRFVSYVIIQFNFQPQSHCTFCDSANLLAFLF